MVTDFPFLQDHSEWLTTAHHLVKQIFEGETLQFFKSFCFKGFLNHVCSFTLLSALGLANEQVS